MKYVTLRQSIKNLSPDFKYPLNEVENSLTRQKCGLVS